MAVEVTSAQAIVPGLVSVSVQFDTPDAGSVEQGEAALRSVPGVRSATTSSLALGGTSVMAVSSIGTAESLRASASGRGWDDAASGNTLRIQRSAQPPASAAAPATGQCGRPLIRRIDQAVRRSRHHGGVETIIYPIHT